MIEKSAFVRSVVAILGAVLLVTVAEAKASCPEIVDDDGNLWDSSIRLCDGSLVIAGTAQLYRAYRGGLGREPDRGGFAWWAGEIDAGRHTVTSMVDGFIGSPEFLGRMGAQKVADIDNGLFLDYMYRNVLGRAPDPAGFAWWLAQMNAGSRSLRDVMFEMTQSNEFVTQTVQDLADFIADDGSGGPDTPESRSCGTAEERELAAEDAAIVFNTLVAGVSTQPIDYRLPDHGNGRLDLGMHPDTVPVLSSALGTHIAASRLESGRVVAFSGQDFIGSQLRSTLVENPNVSQLLRNAALWAGTAENGRVLAANERVARVLRDGTGLSVDVVESRAPVGLFTRHDWSSESIRGYDLLVVQVNEWGTLHVARDDVDAIREFVADGGGLLVAGAALHWSWWLSGFQGHDQFPGDALLQGTGIGFQQILDGDMTAARLIFDASALPESMWCRYVDGSAMNAQQYAMLPGLFSSALELGRSGDLEAGLERLVSDTPPLPARSDDPATRMSARVATELRGATWPSPHPWSSAYPGAVPVGAERTTASVDINTRWKQLYPLGVYAAPGDAVEVHIPPAYAEMGLRVQIGDDLTNTFTGYAAAALWERAPILKQEVALDGPVTTVGSGLGGPLYLWIDDQVPTALLPVRVEGGVPMAVYSRGESTPEQFFMDLAAGAPQAVIQEHGKIRLVVDAEAAQNAAPADVAAFWTGFIDSHMALAQEPEPRPFTSHWLFTPQVGWGYANASSRRIHYPGLAAEWALRTSAGGEDWWLFAHELGHQFQSSDWTGPDTVEVMVNLWSLYTLNFYLNDGGEFETRGYAAFHSIPSIRTLRSKGWANAGFFERLELYRQLVLAFGWTSFEQVMASYYDPEYPRTHFFSGDMDGFAVRMSAVVGRDLTAYLDLLGYPISAAARDRIASMQLSAWVPPGF